MSQFVLQVMVLIAFAVLGTVYAQTVDPLKKEMQAAQAALKEAIPRAAKDPYRPMYHYRPPARWMNEPCGAVYYKGYHHIFHQNNPYSDDVYGWGWGHTRSKDLVHWEVLPFALAPMKHRGERRCNSGCVTVDGNGRPMIFYTFVPTTRTKRSQWAAVPLDDELIRWRRVGDGPLMEAGKNGVPADVPGGWSDPWVFKAKGRTFITFKACGGLVCEAQNKELTDWKCIGKLEGVAGETPNVIKLGDKWVIIRSSPMTYVTGQLVIDGDNIQFKLDGPPKVVDHGVGGKMITLPGRIRSYGFNGTNTYVDDKGRRIMCGHVQGFKLKQGWNGCMSLPRILTLDDNDNLIQTPVPELEKLRGEHKRVADVAVQDELKLIEGAGGRQIEVKAELAPGDAKAFGLKLRSSNDGERALTLRYADGVLNVAGTEVPLKLEGEDKTLKLHVFLDQSVMEVFINDGREVVTRTEYPGEEDLGIAVFAEGGKATLKSLDVWQMKSIW